jgi:hypothetical protein
MTPLSVEATFFAQTHRRAASTGDVPAGIAGVGLYSVDLPSRSLLHRLAYDEIWHFYAGDSPAVPKTCPQRFAGPKAARSRMVFSAATFGTPDQAATWSFSV